MVPTESRRGDSVRVEATRMNDSPAHEKHSQSLPIDSGHFTRLQAVSGCSRRFYGKGTTGETGVITSSCIILGTSLRTRWSEVRILPGAPFLPYISTRYYDLWHW